MKVSSSFFVKCSVLLFVGVVTSFVAAEASNTKSARESNQRQPQGTPFQQCKSITDRIGQTCSTKIDNDTAAEQVTESTSRGEGLSQSNATVLEACNQSGTNAAKSGEALGKISEQCSQAFESCRKSCREAEGMKASLTEKQRKELEDAKKKCESAEGLLAQIAGERERTSQAQGRSQQCQKDAGAGEMPQMPQMPQDQAKNSNSCEENPNSPECFKLKNDCSNPQFAASNEVCRCLGGHCGSSNASTSPDQGMDQSTGYVNDGSITGANGGLAASPKFSASSRSAQNLSGQGGGSLGGSSSGGSGLEDDYLEEESTTTASGGGLGGGSGLVVPEGSLGGGGGSYSNTGAWIPPDMNESPLNMDKFRPQGAGRDPASGSPSQIHGSHVNLWRQINMRYSAMRATLKP